MARKIILTQRRKAAELQCYHLIIVKVALNFVFKRFQWIFICPKISLRLCVFASLR